MSARKTQNSKDISMRKYIIEFGGDVVITECSPTDLPKEIAESWDQEYVEACTIYDITDLKPMKLKASYTLS